MKGIKGHGRTLISEIRPINPAFVKHILATFLKARQQTNGQVRERKVHDQIVVTTYRTCDVESNHLCEDVIVESRP